MFYVKYVFKYVYTRNALFLNIYKHFGMLVAPHDYDDFSFVKKKKRVCIHIYIYIYNIIIIYIYI